MTNPNEPSQSSSTGWPSETPAAPAVPPPVEPVEPVVPVAPVAPVAPPAEPEPVAPPAAAEPAAPLVEPPVEPAAPPPAAPVEVTPPPGPAAESAIEAPTPPAPVEAPTPPAPVEAQPAAATAVQPLPAVDPVEPAAPPAPSAARPASAWRSPPVLALLLTTVLMAVAAGFVWYQVHQKDATESARKAGLETSRDAARVLFSYDYRTLDKDFSAGKAITTGAFQKSYGDTTSKVVAPVAKDKKAVVKAEVVAAGVVRATPSTVVTVVFVNQVTTSSLATAPKVDLSRVRMTLKHVGGRWLVSDVKAL